MRGDEWLYPESTYGGMSFESSTENVENGSFINEVQA